MKIQGFAAATLTLLALAACQKQDVPQPRTAGPAEEAGRKLDQAAAEIQPKLNELGQKAGQVMQDAGRKMQETAREGQPESDKK